jgi:hypothetical protein
VYHMINCLREMRPIHPSLWLDSIIINVWQAIDYFLTLPNHRNLAKYRISPQEWGVMQDLEVILGVHRNIYLLYTWHWQLFVPH